MFVVFSTSARFYEVTRAKDSGSPKYNRVGDVTCQVRFTQESGDHSLVVSTTDDGEIATATVDIGNERLGFKGVSIHDRKSAYYTDDRGVERMLSFETREVAGNFSMVMCIALYCANGQSSNAVTRLNFLSGAGAASSKPGDEIVVKFMGMVATHHPSLETYVLTSVFETSRDDDETTYRRTTLGTHDVMPGWEPAISGMAQGEIRYFAMPSAMGCRPDDGGSILVYGTECHAAYSGEVSKTDSIKGRLAKFSPGRMLAEPVAAVVAIITPKKKVPRPDIEVETDTSINRASRERSGTELEFAEDLIPNTSMGTPLLRGEWSADKYAEKMAKLDAKKRKLREADEDIQRRERDVLRQQNDFDARARVADIESAKHVGVLQTELKKLRRELAKLGNTPAVMGNSFDTRPTDSTLAGGSRSPPQRGGLDTSQNAATSVLYDAIYEGEPDLTFPLSLKRSHYFCSSLVDLLGRRNAVYLLIALLLTGIVFIVYNVVKYHRYRDLVWLVVAVPSAVTLGAFTVRQHTYYDVVTALDRQFHAHGPVTSSYDHIGFLGAMGLALGSIAVVVFRIASGDGGQWPLDPLTFVFPTCFIIHTAVVMFLLLVRALYVEQCRGVLSVEVGSLTSEYAMREVFICIRHLKTMLHRAGTLWNWYFILSAFQAVGGLTLLGLAIGYEDNFGPTVRYLFWDALLLHAVCLLWVGRGWVGAHHHISRTVWIHFESWAGATAGGDLTHRDFADMIALLEASGRNDDFAAWRVLRVRIPEWACLVLLAVLAGSLGLQAAKISMG